MADNGKSFGSLRFNRFDIERFAVVLAFSLAAHLIVFGGYEISKELNLFPWLRSLTQVKPLPPQVQQEAPVEFAMVQNPSTVAPKNAKYYGAQNSAAADQSQKDSEQPELSGKQPEIPETQDSTHLQISKSPSGLDLQGEKNPQQSAESQPSLNMGDLILGKPKDTDQQRPRTVNQARAQMANQRPSQQMQQNGGVHRVALVPSLDVKATPFGGYDQGVFDAIQQYWNDELDKINYDGSAKGKVVVRFRLNFDGHISNVEILDTNEGEMMTMMCQLAVENPAPFGAWTEDMRHIFGTDRLITITFFYE